jgi:hypothetical protein
VRESSRQFNASRNFQSHLIVAFVFRLVVSQPIRQSNGFMVLLVSSQRVSAMARPNHELTLTDPNVLREAQIAKIAESKESVAALREHLHEITEGKAFRGSHRSVQFLVYIVDQAIAGRFDSLKERMIGIELFGRPPSYDTGEDAIVRVTASDVRRRLLQYYGENGRSSNFQISLHSGSYIPEIIRAQHNGADPAPRTHAAGAATGDNAAPAQAGSPPAAHDSVLQLPEGEPDSRIRSLQIAIRNWGLWLSLGSLSFTLAAIACGVFWFHSSQHTAAAAVSSMPWSTLVNSAHATHLITSDPNIVYIQEITGGELSLSDYANRNYIPEPTKLSPEALRLCRIFLWGDNSAAAVDAPIALKIQSVTQSGAKRIDAHAARSIRMSDIKSDDNFIFLGSPRSNPWTTLFSDQLDFRFVFDKASNQEIIVNEHPHAGEQKTYVPTAQGWATGQSFGIIAFVQNPDQNGQVLLLAGANGEGTEAAGNLATDVPRLTAALSRCGVSSGKPLQHFEILLALKTMAGSPNDVDIAACHLL